MTLLQGCIGETYIVQEATMDRDIEMRLEVLGLTRGTKLQILIRKNNGALIIKVRGTRLAVGKEISGKIKVTPIETEGEGRRSK